MESLEKMMYFVPNRLYVVGSEMYVSFDISSIPVDMEVVKMTLNVPLPDSEEAIFVVIREIASGWDVNMMSQGYRPPHPVTVARIALDGGQREAVVDLTSYQPPWRFASLENHGVYVRLSVNGEPLDFPEDVCPYLVLSII